MLSFTSNPNLPKKSYKLYEYENILLKTYFEIAETGNLNLLNEKSQAPQHELETQWEKILKENSLATGSMEYQNYFEDIREYGKLMAEAMLVRASILRLMFTVDDEVIAMLAEKGYRIDTSSATKYNITLEASLKRCNNYQTKLKIKHNDIELKQKGKKKISLGEILANLSAVLGFDISDSITLAKFNGYQKIAKIKVSANKPKKQQ